MLRTSRLAAAGALAALLVTGCSSSTKDDAPPPTFAEMLQGGLWIDCHFESGLGADLREALVFTSGSTLDFRVWHHLDTANGTCGGFPTISDIDSDSGTFVLGSTVQVPNPVGAGTVTAYQVDVTAPSKGTFYSLAWIDTGVSPNKLYLGDDSGANDGSVPALRPTTLQTMGRVRLASPTPFPASLQGSFAACRNDGGSDYREVLAFVGTDVEVRKYDYGSAGTSCLGDGWLDGAASGQGTLALGGTVDASLGALTVGATVADFQPVGGSTLYTIVWVDALASVKTLYWGDDSGALDGTIPSLRPDTLQMGIPRFAFSTNEAYPGVVQGTWDACTWESTFYQRERFAFSGGSVTISTFDHAGDATCSGAGTPIDTSTMAFTVGSATPVTLGALDVTGYTLDLGSVFYTTVYVDPYAWPTTLYIGDELATGGLDGSTPAKRPTVLQDWKPRFRR